MEAKPCFSKVAAHLLVHSTHPRYQGTVLSEAQDVAPELACPRAVRPDSAQRSSARLRPAEPVRSLLRSRRRTRRSHPSCSAVACEVDASALGSVTQSEARASLPHAPGKAARWRGSTGLTPTISRFVNCAARRLSRCTDREQRHTHLEAVALERALRFVRVAVADMHPVRRLCRVGARGNHLAAALRRTGFSAHSKSGARPGAPGTREAPSHGPPAETRTPSPTCRPRPAAGLPVRPPGGGTLSRLVKLLRTADSRAPDTGRRPPETQLETSEALPLRA